VIFTKWWKIAYEIDSLPPHGAKTLFYARPADESNACRISYEYWLIDKDHLQTIRDITPVESSEEIVVDVIGSERLRVVQAYNLYGEGQDNAARLLRRCISVLKQLSANIVYDITLQAKKRMNL